MYIREGLKFLLIFLCLVVFAACTRPDNSTPNDIGVELFHLFNPTFIDLDADYEEFVDLFYEQSAGDVTKESFTELKEGTSSNVSLATIQLLRFEGGNTYLVYLYPELVNGEYKIYDIVPVPAELEYFFNESGYNLKGE